MSKRLFVVCINLSIGNHRSLQIELYRIYWVFYTVKVGEIPVNRILKSTPELKFARVYSSDMTEGFFIFDFNSELVLYWNIIHLFRRPCITRVPNRVDIAHEEYFSNG